MDGAVVALRILIPGIHAAKDVTEMSPEPADAGGQLRSPVENSLTHKGKH